MDDQSKRKSKEALLNRLKGLQMTKQMPQGQQQFPMQMQMSMPSQPPMRVDTQQDFRKMPYEGKAKYDNELKALNALKNETQQRNQKPKKMFFQHYDTVEPYCPIIQNNTNPSGRPPNIPPQMYQGITVKPKRPWVYMGTQNLPPVQYQEINQANFKTVQKKQLQPTKQQQNKKKGPAGSQTQKPRKKTEEADLQQNSEISNQIDMEEGESIFASRYNETSSKYLQSSKRGRQSQAQSRNSEQQSYMEDYEQSDGTETKKNRVDIFQSGDNDEDDYYDEDEEEEVEKSRGKAKNSKKDNKRKNKQQDQYSD